MIYGLYLSGQGAQVQMVRQDVVANNLANAQTTAFKRELLTAQAHSTFDSQQGNRTWLPGNLDNLPGGVTAGGTATDFSQGELQHTQAPFDVALQGKGFLKVLNGKETYLTRNGQLSVGPQNQLVTRDQGFPVLNAEGAASDGDRSCIADRCATRRHVDAGERLPSENWGSWNRRIIRT